MARNFDIGWETVDRDEVTRVGAGVPLDVAGPGRQIDLTEDYREHVTELRVVHVEHLLVACDDIEDPARRAQVSAAALAYLGEAARDELGMGGTWTPDRAAVAGLPARMRFGFALAELSLIEAEGRPVDLTLPVEAREAFFLAGPALEPRAAALRRRLEHLHDAALAAVAPPPRHRFTEAPLPHPRTSVENL